MNFKINELQFMFCSNLLSQFFELIEIKKILYALALFLIISSKTKTIASCSH